MTDQPTPGAPTHALQLDSAEAAQPHALQFDTAEPISSRVPAEVKCDLCAQPIITSYHRAGGKTFCSPCRGRIETERGDFAKAILQGSAVAIAGSIAGGLALKLLNLPFLVVFIGLAVGQTVFKASGERGGRRYQIFAAIACYLGMAWSFTPAVVSGAASGGDLPAAVVWIVSWFVSFAIPFLIVKDVPFIIVVFGIAIYRAWTLNRRVEVVFTGPYAIATNAEPEPALA